MIIIFFNLNQSYPQLVLFLLNFNSGVYKIVRVKRNTFLVNILAEIIQQMYDHSERKRKKREKERKERKKKNPEKYNTYIKKNRLSMVIVRS